MNKKVKIVLIIAAVIILIEAVAVGALLVVRHNTESSYAYHLELAQKYLSDGDYEGAIAEFSAAIEISPKKEDAYTGMADACIAMGDYESAVEILNEGYDATASKTVKRKLKSAKELIAGADETEESVSEAETLTAMSEIEDEMAETVSEQESSGVQDGEACEASGEFEYAERLTYDVTEAEDENNIAEGSYEGVSWWIDSDGVLYVEGTGDFSIGTRDDRSPWFSYRTDITEAVLNLTGATDLSCMFAWGSALENVDLSGLDTSDVTSMGVMFDGCSALKSIDLSGLDTSSVKYMASMFYDCSSLESIDLSGLDTSNVKYMSTMFYGCSSLESLDVSDLNTSNVEDMSYMFCECSALKILDLSGWDVGNVTYAEDMLDGCTALTTIYTPKNLSVSVSLPTTSSSTAWYMSDGTVVTELPQNLSYSVVLKRQ